ncbi:hypothetical protein ABTH71_20430, partial [Acinetobacter baumannii]
RLEAQTDSQRSSEQGGAYRGPLMISEFVFLGSVRMKPANGGSNLGRYAGHVVTRGGAAR